MRVGVLHPGAMGTSVATAAKAGGAEVRWASAGRGDATRARAEGAGLDDAGTLTALAAAVDLIISVCPPAAAADVARDVAATGFTGTYLDANAVAPATARDIGGILAQARFVDGGIVGPPAREPGTTRLYLAGDDAGTVADLFAGTALATVVLDGPAGAASALKMCFAAHTKGSTAMLLAIRALAVAEGVDDALVAEWTLSLPELAQRSEQAARGTAPKAWRFTGEMEQIAATFAAAGLPDGFHAAAAEVYRRLAPLREVPEPDLADAIAALLAARP